MGDYFLKDTQQSLFSLNKAAKKCNQDPPHLFKEYNISAYYCTSTISNPITRLMNAFVDTLNQHNLLPKLVIVIPDKDLLRGVLDKQGASIMVGSTVHQIIKQMDIEISCRKLDIADKKPRDPYLMSS